MLEIPEPTAVEKESPNAAFLDEQIALRAYQLYAARGYVDGLDLQDWLQAEQEVFKQLDQQARRANAAAA